LARKNLIGTILYMAAVRYYTEKWQQHTGSGNPHAANTRTGQCGGEKRAVGEEGGRQRKSRGFIIYWGHGDIAIMVLVLNFLFRYSPNHQL
jgi:hypothetical protein